MGALGAGGGTCEYLAVRLCNLVGAVSVLVHSSPQETGGKTRSVIGELTAWTAPVQDFCNYVSTLISSVQISVRCCELFHNVVFQYSFGQFLSSRDAALGSPQGEHFEAFGLMSVKCLPTLVPSGIANPRAVQEVYVWHFGMVLTSLVFQNIDFLS